MGEHASDARRDAADEFGFHMEMRARELMAAGMAEEEAWRRARAAFGDAGRVAAEVESIAAARLRRRRFSRLLLSLRKDVRIGLRGLRRDPGFAVAAAVTLALGIGANALVFGVMEAALLRAPAVRSPETLAAVYTTCRRGDPRCASSYPDYEDYGARARSFEDVAAYAPRQLTLADAGGAEVVEAELVSGNYFAVLGVGAATGRPLTAEDDRPGVGPVAVLSHGFWRTRFGGDRDVIGRSVRLNEAAYMVVGVAPPGFSGIRLGAAPALWVPIHGVAGLFPDGMGAGSFDSRATRWIDGLVARLQPDTPIEQARAELLSVSAQLAREDSAARGPRTVTVDPLPRYVLPAGSEDVIASFLWVLQAVVAITLLLACANLANLLLARGGARRRELAVRAALGAGRTRLVRQLLTESALLACIGGAAGLVLAGAALSAIGAFRLPFGFEIDALRAGINGRVAAFTLTVTALTAAGFGTLPALHATRGDLADALREASAGGRSAGRLLRTLVGVQVALCVVLLAGAGLFLRTLQDRLNTDLGFRPDGVGLMVLDPSMTGYDAARNATLSADLVARIRSLPGVASASAATRVPVREALAGTFVEVDGYTPPPDEEMRVEYNLVAPDYFRTLDLPIVRGREFDARDAAGAPLVVIVNEEMARAWWPGRAALGGSVSLFGRQHTVVGVARDAAWRGLETSGTAYVYVPRAQVVPLLSSFTLSIVARADPTRMDALLEGMRGALRTVDPRLAPTHMGTMRQAVETTVAPQRAAASLLSGFAILALVLATVGIYGVVSYGVARKRRDLGIRMALGAGRRSLVSLVARGMGPPVLFGLIAGLFAAAALARVLRGMIHGLAPTEPALLAVAVAILVAAALAATLIPARRAARADPLTAMRTD